MSTWTSRRTFLETVLSLGVFSVSSRSLTAFAQSHPLSMLTDALRLGQRLRRAEITQTDWQEQIGPIMERVTVDELSAAITLEALRRRAPHVTRGTSVVVVPQLNTLPHDDGAAIRVFFFRAGRTDPPHCHFNSVTAHRVLSGRFRVTHWDRLSEEPGRFILRQTRVRTIGPGDLTSISEQRENAHWHEALTDGVLLDIEQGRLNPAIPPRSRQMVDTTARARPDGTIVARALTSREAHRRFG
ncbi:MAG: hypothetical protein Q8Q09_10955 [Deltaproteobacteria bacterium]|nr:hypothetical protein [Deltaproteobacteria bacterium]